MWGEVLVWRYPGCFLRTVLRGGFLLEGGPSARSNQGVATRRGSGTLQAWKPPVDGMSPGGFLLLPSSRMGENDGLAGFRPVRKRSLATNERKKKEGGGQGVLFFWPLEQRKGIEQAGGC